MFQPELADALQEKHPLLSEEYRKHKDTPNLCFKRCKYHLLGMQYNSDANNLARNGVKYKPFAKFRAKSVKVLFIYDVQHRKLIPEWKHENGWTNVWYRVDKYTFADWWDASDVDDVCTHGIHFYLSLIAAICYITYFNGNNNFQDSGVCVSAPTRYQMENATSEREPNWYRKKIF